MTETLTADKLEAIEKRLTAERQRREIISRGAEDLIFYAQTVFKLRPKVGPLQPLIFNAAQNHLHEVCERQKRETGRVRVVVLKARQLGVSTYVAARFLHDVLHNPARRCFICAHEKRAAANLYGIVRRYYDNLPSEIRPETSASSQEELIFAEKDSGYLVGTATLEGAGRSATSQLLLASVRSGRTWPRSLHR
jgi:hypothetical protein